MTVQKSKESKEKMTKRKHLLYKGLGALELYPCLEVMIRVPCFIAILFKGARGLYSKRTKRTEMRQKGEW